MNFPPREQWPHQSLGALLPDKQLALCPEAWGAPSAGFLSRTPRATCPGLMPGSATSQLCDLEPVTAPMSELASEAQGRDTHSAAGWDPLGPTSWLLQPVSFVGMSPGPGAGYSPVPTLAHSVTLGKPLLLSVPCFPHPQNTFHDT